MFSTKPRSPQPPQPPPPQPSPAHAATKSPRPPHPPLSPATPAPTFAAVAATSSSSTATPTAAAAAVTPSPTTPAPTPASTTTKRRQRQRVVRGAACSATVGGYEAVLASLRQAFWVWLSCEHLVIAGVVKVAGVLLHGPSGVGKTWMVHAMCREMGCKVVHLTASDMTSTVVADSEERLRQAFESACTQAPCIVFLDELDQICPHRASASQHDSRIVAQLLTLMDGLQASKSLVIAASNKVNSIDPALRRPGRFDKELRLDPPTEQERIQIFQLHSSKFPLAKEVDLSLVASQCHGFVGADIAGTCRHAALTALSDPHSLEVVVTQAHFLSSMKEVGASVRRGTEVEVAFTSWKDIGGLDSVQHRLRQVVEWPLLHPESFKRMGLGKGGSARGVLLYGPPGCCKTTLARVVASSVRASFFTLSGAEVVSPLLGEAEREIRTLFHRARACAPSIVFLDEVDALVASRDDAVCGDGGISRRILATLLNEMDGVELAPGVLVMGATNRPASIDAALLRPGRFDELIYVPPPDLKGRMAILELQTKHYQMSDETRLWLPSLAVDTERFTGAELRNLCTTAALLSLRQSLSNTVAVEVEHFKAARSSITPCVTPEMLAVYSSFQNAL